MLKFKFQQRGALFGLDARLMLAIFSGLSVVTGLSMSGVVSGSKATGLAKDIESYSHAVEAIQHDLGNNIHSITSVDNAKNFIALFELDTSYLDSARQEKWLGPYIEEHIISSNKAQHRFFGDLELSLKEKNGSTICDTSNRNACFYWLSIKDVPLTVAEDYNKKVDGESETTPSAKGIVQWSGVGPVTLSTRLTAAIKN